MIETVFWGALIILLYAYLGYPLLIGALAWFFPRQVRRGPYEPRVAVVIVAYNEAARIGRKLDTCIGLNYPGDKLRIIVASDGSDDGTNEIVSAHADSRVTLLAFPQRRGKAACLNDAIAATEEDIVVLTDARQRFDAQAIRHLAEDFADPEVGAVSGELVFETDGVTEFGEGVDAYWRYEKFIRKQESRWHSVVGVTGALYALRRECFRRIPEDTILDDVVIPMDVVMAGSRVVFEGRAKVYDLPSHDHRQERLRKVRTLAGNFQLIAAQSRLFNPLCNPIFLQLVSHKILRLLGPYLMATLLITNLILFDQAAVFQYFLAVQLFGYALAVGGVVWPYFNKWRAVKLASTFLLLNWFAVLGLSEYLRNRNAHLWNSGKMASSRNTQAR